MATPNATFRPCFEEGERVLEVDGDFVLPLLVLLLVALGVTATAICAVAGAFALGCPLLTFMTLPEYGL